MFSYSNALLCLADIVSFYSTVPYSYIRITTWNILFKCLDNFKNYHFPMLSYARAIFVEYSDRLVNLCANGNYCKLFLTCKSTNAVDYPYSPELVPFPEVGTNRTAANVDVPLKHQSINQSINQSLKLSNY